MAIQTINIGTTANDGTGDDPRTAGSKINDNFTNSNHAASRDVGTTVGDVMEVGAFGLGGTTNGSVTGVDWGATGASPTQFIASSVNGPSGNPVVGVKIRAGSGVSTILAGIDGKYYLTNQVLNWAREWDSTNTTVDGSGFIKSASPIVKLYADRIEANSYKEIENCTFERVTAGHYIIKGAPLLSRDGWYIETLKDRNNNIYFTLDYEELEDGLHIKTYEPDYSTGRATNGAPVDINEGRFVTLRFKEDKTEE